MALKLRDVPEQLATVLQETPDAKRRQPWRRADRSSGAAAQGSFEATLNLARVTADGVAMRVAPAARTDPLSCKLHKGVNVFRACSLDSEFIVRFLPKITLHIMH